MSYNNVPLRVKNFLKQLGFLLCLKMFRGEKKNIKSVFYSHSRTKEKNFWF